MKKVLFAAACAATLTGCKGMHFDMGSGVEGSGKLKTEDRKVSGFTGIDNDSIGSIVVKVGPKESLKITADDNLLKLFKTEVKGDVLKIWTDKNIKSADDIRIEITVPKLENVSNDGVGSIDVDGVKSEKFILTMDGVGSTTINGEVNELEVSVDGVGSASLFGLKAKKVNAETDGVGSIEVTATESITARVDGVGSIVYKGKPKSVSTSRDGVGSISEG